MRRARTFRASNRFPSVTSITPAGLGIDCRYCHTTVETSSFANIPATKICMNCHSQMWAVAPELEPVRESYRTGDRSSGRGCTIFRISSISITAFIFIKESAVPLAMGVSMRCRLPGKPNLCVCSGVSIVTVTRSDISARAIAGLRYEL